MKLLGLILVALMSLHSCSEVSANKLKILIPLYIYPTSNNLNLLWKKIATLSKHVSIVAIINPHHGPGAGQKPDANYQAALELLKKEKVTILGYVSTKYTKRSVLLIEQDINKYANWASKIRVDGIFFDEVTNTRSGIAFYRKIANYVKRTQLGNGAIIALNQGTNFDKEYLTIGDISVTSEMNFDSWKHFNAGVAIRPADRSKLSVMIHSCSNEQDMKSVIDKAIREKMGYVYVTDDIYRENTNDEDKKDPWDSLPTYFNEEVKYIQRMNKNF